MVVMIADIGFRVQGLPPPAARFLVMLYSPPSGTSSSPAAALFEVQD